MSEVPEVRTVALTLLLDWDRRKQVFMETLVNETLSEHSFDDRDRRFLTELCYGCIRHRNTLRVVSEHYLSGPLSEYSRSVRAALSPEKK